MLLGSPLEWWYADRVPRVLLVPLELGPHLFGQQIELHEFHRAIEAERAHVAARGKPRPIGDRVRCVSSGGPDPGYKPLIRTIGELTPQWLSAALGRDVVELRETERSGTGQMSHSHRVTFTADGSDGEPESVVLKLASTDPNSRSTGIGMGAYFREVAFYRNLAPRLGDPVPRCHLAEYDASEGWFTLLLEDISGAVQGDQIAGCDVEQARTAQHSLARIHAPVLGDPALGAANYLNQPSPLTTDLLKMLLAGFLERYRGRVAPEHAEVCERFVPVLEPWAIERTP